MCTRGKGSLESWAAGHEAAGEWLLMRGSACHCQQEEQRVPTPAKCAMIYTVFAASCWDDILFTLAAHTYTSLTHTHKWTSATVVANMFHIRFQFGIAVRLLAVKNCAKTKAIIFKC